MTRSRFFTATLLVLLLLGLAACGGDSDDGASSESAQPVASAGDPQAGEQQFNQVCIACHGSGGIGVEGLGKSFITSEYLPTVSDQELLTFIKTGRPVGDPLNTTGVDMPPKGGNPALSDEQIMDIIAYIRTLHQ